MDSEQKARLNKVAGIVSAVVAVLVSVAVYAALVRYDQTWAAVASGVSLFLTAGAVWWHLE